MGQQLRAMAAEKQIRSGQMVRGAIGLVILVILLIVGPGIYHSVKGAYLKHSYEEMNKTAVDKCNGQPDLDKCLADNPDLKRSKDAYDDFTNGGKH